MLSQKRIEYTSKTFQAWGCYLLLHWSFSPVRVGFLKNHVLADHVAELKVADHQLLSI